MSQIRPLTGSSVVSSLPLRPQAQAANPAEHTTRPGAAGGADEFRADFTDLFAAHYQRLFRCIDRLSGDPALADDLVQEAFLKLYARGSLPDSPAAWLITVALNHFRNAQSTRNRRRFLLTAERASTAHSDAEPTPAQATLANDERARVRRALDKMTERERHMLLLHAEGYSYREIAQVLAVAQTSVGTLLARARATFRTNYEDAHDAR